MTPPKKKVDKKWYFAPLIPAVLWVIFSFISLFTINFSVISDPFVLISILSRFLFPIYSIYFIKKFYYTGKLRSLDYNHMLNFIGYSISITYVSYMLPAVVLDFYQSGTPSLVFTVLVILSALCPMVLYLLLRSGVVKLASTYFTSEDILNQKKSKKDKKLKKQLHKKLRKQRSFLQNVWFEALDPLMWAILWVLIINNSIFQLYEIPSSSMVPEFLVKDRVVASKLFSGPAIPLTKYHLPELSKPKVGDIVTFNNPKVDDVDSDLHYKNVFTRIFQPFVFMLSFSKLDIDTDDYGNPKARQLVKRVIAVPGEKISMVNDKVYKKVQGGEWTLMSDIPGQKEWGHNDLFELDSKNSGVQYMNPKLREELDLAAELVLESNATNLERELEVQKDKFLEHLRLVDTVPFLNTLMSYNRTNSSRIIEILEGLGTNYGQMMQVNRADAPLKYKKAAFDSFNENLERYELWVYSQKINELGVYLQDGPDLMNNRLSTNVSIPSDASPYESFVIKLNALTKLKSLILFNQILETGELKNGSTINKELKALSIYTKGLELGLDSPMSFFGQGNLPEYPAGTDNYISENEYFVLGDNRYNSLDSRMGDLTYSVPLAPGDVFSENVIVSWEPHTIDSKYIHGKVKLILFPFTHFKLF